MDRPATLCRTQPCTVCVTAISKETPRFGSQDRPPIRIHHETDWRFLRPNHFRDFTQTAQSIWAVSETEHVASSQLYSFTFLWKNRGQFVHVTVTKRHLDARLLFSIWQHEQLPVSSGRSGFKSVVSGRAWWELVRAVHLHRCNLHLLDFEMSSSKAQAVQVAPSKRPKTARESPTWRSSKRPSSKPRPVRTPLNHSVVQLTYLERSHLYGFGDKGDAAGCREDMGTCEDPIDNNH